MVSFCRLFAGFPLFGGNDREHPERRLEEVRKDVKQEKPEAAKTEAKTALAAKVSALSGSNKLKAEREELQQRISALESQNEELVRHIETMEREHGEERTKFNELWIRYSGTSLLWKSCCRCLTSAGTPCISQKG